MAKVGMSLPGVPSGPSGRPHSLGRHRDAVEGRVRALDERILTTKIAFGYEISQNAISDFSSPTFHGVFSDGRQKRVNHGFHDPLVQPLIYLVRAQMTIRSSPHHRQSSSFVHFPQILVVHGARYVRHCAHSFKF